MDKCVAQKVAALMDNIKRVQRAIEKMDNKECFDVIVNNETDKLELSNKEKMLLGTEINEFLYRLLEDYEDQLKTL